MATRPPAPGRDRGIRWRWVWLTAFAAFVVWHAIFDVTIDRGMRAYVDARARYVRSEGPEVAIRGSMAAARSRGAQWGLGGAAVVMALSFVVSRLLPVRNRS